MIPHPNSNTGGSIPEPGNTEPQSQYRFAGIVSRPMLYQPTTRQVFCAITGEQIGHGQVVNGQLMLYLTPDPMNN